MGLLAVEYEKGHSPVQRIDEMECSGNAAIRETSEWATSENLIAQRTVSKGRQKKMKGVHRGYNQVRWL